MRVLEIISHLLHVNPPQALRFDLLSGNGSRVFTFAQQDNFTFSVLQINILCFGTSLIFYTSSPEDHIAGHTGEVVDDEIEASR